MVDHEKLMREEVRKLAESGRRLWNPQPSASTVVINIYNGCNECRHRAETEKQEVVERTEA